MTVSELACTRFAYSPLAGVGEDDERAYHYRLTVTG
jgi:hypothetical protein